MFNNIFLQDAPAKSSQRTGKEEMKMVVEDQRTLGIEMADLTYVKGGEEDLTPEEPIATISGPPVCW